MRRKLHKRSNIFLRLCARRSTRTPSFPVPPPAPFSTPTKLRFVKRPRYPVHGCSSTCLPPPVFSHVVLAMDLGCGAWMTKLTGIT